MIEYFLFGGVPEAQEPMYGSGEYQFQGSFRQTRSGPSTSLHLEEHQSGNVIGYMEYDLESGKLILVDNITGTREEI